MAAQPSVALSSQPECLTFPALVGAPTRFPLHPARLSRGVPQMGRGVTAESGDSRPAGQGYAGAQA